jgi:hypothetical protein
VTRRINIPDPQELLRHIAGMYQSATRVIMEYIDNSLDDAEAFYEEKGRYPYPIEVTLEVDQEDHTVTITDNCRGMSREKLVRIVEYVGSSDKKAQPWTNGQFGFGVHAFRACCARLEIVTKSSRGRPWRMHIDRDSNDIPDELELPASLFPFQSGTVITLRKFDAGWWREISSRELASEIELHFNHLLRREHLHLQVTEGERVLICKPYDISIFEGEEFDFDINQFQDARKDMAISLLHPLEVRLKVCSVPVYDRFPLFFNKGRRIDEVRKTKSYLAVSAHKGKVWSHPHLIGYIEVNGNLEPTLDRADFKRTRNRRPIFEELVAIEEFVHESLSRIVQSTNAESLGRLGSLLTRLLEQIAREDRMILREAFAEGGDIHLDLMEEQGAAAELAFPGEGGEEGQGSSSGEPQGEIEPGEEALRVEESEKTGDTTGRRRRSSGFLVRFDDTALDALIQEDGSTPRSSLIGDTINIYVNHPDFGERARRVPHGGLKLTSRLASYVAAIMAGHYKDAYYVKYKLQPEIRRLVGSRTAMFDDFIGFSCRLETMLQGYVGADLEELKEV